MVCFRCKMVVKLELERLNLGFKSLEVGEVELYEDISIEKKNMLNESLKKSGLELIDEKRGILIEKIKVTIIDLVHYSDEPLKTRLSDYISKKLNYDYNSLAKLFSDSQGTSIDKFYIRHKIEKAKELLLYDELNLKQIALKLRYSSVAHLSGQFKKITGFTPSQFRELKNKRRIVLENV